MSGKTKSRRDGKPSDRLSVKLCVRVSLDTATRLGCLAALRRKTKAALVEEALLRLTEGLRLPSLARSPAGPGDALHGAPGALEGPAYGPVEL